MKTDSVLHVCVLKLIPLQVVLHRIASIDVHVLVDIAWILRILGYNVPCHSKLIVARRGGACGSPFLIV